MRLYGTPCWETNGNARSGNKPDPFRQYCSPQSNQQELAKKNATEVRQFKCFGGPRSRGMKPINEFVERNEKGTHKHDQKYLRRELTELPPGPDTVLEPWHDSDPPFGCKATDATWIGWLFEPTQAMPDLHSGRDVP